MAKEHQEHKLVKPVLDALANGFNHFHGAGRSYDFPREEVRKDRAHNQGILSGVRKAEERSENFRERPGEGSVRLREPTGELERWEKIVAADDAKLKEIITKQNEQFAFAGSYGTGQRHALAYLRKLPAGAELIPNESKLLPARKGEPEHAAANRLADEIPDALALRKKIERQGRDPDEAKAAWRKYVNELADSGTPDFSPLFGPKGTRPLLRTHYVDGESRPNTFLLNAWLHRDALIAAGERELDEVAALDGTGITAKDRAEKLADLDAVIFEKESAYEAIWRGLALAGVFIPRRTILSGDARTILGLSDSMPRIQLSFLDLNHAA